MCSTLRPLLSSWPILAQRTSALTARSLMRTSVPPVKNHLIVCHIIHHEASHAANTQPEHRQCPSRYCLNGAWQAARRRAEDLKVELARILHQP
eukprot:3997071-Pyramimonas_sp.AAC.1